MTQSTRLPFMNGTVLDAEATHEYHNTSQPFHTMYYCLCMATVYVYIQIYISGFNRYKNYYNINGSLAFCYYVNKCRFCGMCFVIVFLTLLLTASHGFLCLPRQISILYAHLGDIVTHLNSENSNKHGPAQGVCEIGDGSCRSCRRNVQ